MTLILSFRMINFKNSRRLGLILLLIMAQSYLNRSLGRVGVAWVEPPAEQQQKFNPTLFRVLSFGQLPIAIDWLLIKCLVDTTMNKVAPGMHSRFYYDLELMTDLDPASLDAYLLGGNLLAVIQDDGVGARDLLSKGRSFLKNTLSSYPSEFQIQNWRSPWRLYTLEGYVHLFMLKNLPQAALAFRDAAHYPSAPEYLSRLTERLRKPGGGYEVALKLLRFMESTSHDVRVIDELKLKQDHLAKAQYLYKLNQSFSDFIKHLNEVGDESHPPVFFQRFLMGKQFSGRPEQAKRDPWGGTLFLSSSGKVETTTPHESELGLE